MSAEHLLGEHRHLEPAVGQIALDDRGEDRNNVVGGDPFLLGRGLVAQIDLQRTPQEQRTGGLVERTRFHQHAADVGMNHQAVRFRIRVARFGLQRATLAAVLRVDHRILIGDLALR